MMISNQLFDRYVCRRLRKYRNWVFRTTRRSHDEINVLNNNYVHFMILPLMYI